MESLFNTWFSFKMLLSPIFQFAATSLMSICQRIGQEMTALHVLPQLKELFDEFAFSEKSTDASDSLSWKIRTAEQKFHPESPIKSRMDLVCVFHLNHQ
jgi:WD repeat-containing protein 81